MVRHAFVRLKSAVCVGLCMNLLEIGALNRHIFFNELSAENAASQKNRLAKPGTKELVKKCRIASPVASVFIH